LIAAGENREQLKEAAAASEGRKLELTVEI